MPRRTGAQANDTAALFWDQRAEQAALGAALVNPRSRSHGSLRRFTSKVTLPDLLEVVDHESA